GRRLSAVARNLSAGAPRAKAGALLAYESASSLQQAGRPATHASGRIRARGPRTPNFQCPRLQIHVCPLRPERFPKPKPATEPDRHECFEWVLATGGEQ